MRILREHYLRDDIEHGIGNQLEQKPSLVLHQWRHTRIIGEIVIHMLSAQVD